MKKIFFSLIIILQFVQLASAETKIMISAKNYKSAKMNIAWFGADGQYIVQGIPINDSSGEITIDAPEGTSLSLVNLDSRNSITMGNAVMPGISFTFFAEKGTIKISFDGDHWPLLTIEGGTLSKDCNNYWNVLAPIEKAKFENRKKSIGLDKNSPNPELDKEREILEKEKEIIQHSFIVKNPGSLLAIDILSERFLKYSLEEVEQLYKNFGNHVKQTVKGKALAAKIIEAKATLPGMPAPKFTKKDKEGKQISLDNYKGKYVLIDFWGTWCKPCRASFPHLIMLYNKYKSLGLEFINIAQEGGKNARDKWLKAIDEDGLVWTQILNDEEMDKCDVVKLYNIQVFPTKVLIDPKGNIVDTWIGESPKFDEKLKEIFGK
ncbi:MAG: TlpA disulfide reductase family protein [Bacteroidales bacterium]|nr:TlpA disulfide reductase family protein [Bacteroidales bacterium]